MHRRYVAAASLLMAFAVAVSLGAGNQASLRKVASPVSAGLYSVEQLGKVFGDFNITRLATFGPNVSIAYWPST